MLYSSLRSSIKTGDVFFTAQDSWFSRLIRLFTRSNVSHVGVFYWLGDRLMVFEMLTDGAHTTFASEYIDRMLSDGVSVSVGKIRHHRDRSRIVSEIEKLSQAQYDFVGAIESVLGRWNIPSKYFCSEAVAHILGLSRVTSTRSFTPDDVGERCHEMVSLGR